MQNNELSELWKDEKGFILFEITFAFIVSFILGVFKFFDIINISWIWTLSPIIVLIWVFFQLFVSNFIYLIIKEIRKSQ